MRLIAIISTFLLAGIGTANAEVIQISVSKQSPELQAVVRPTSGMKKADVERVFGAPQRVDGPIGEPPIASWFYADYTVYFEHDTVLHSVLRNTPPPTAEAPAQE